MWFESSFKRNLVDMHIADWDPEFLSRFDPEAYAEAVSASGADAAIVYAGSCLGICYWPSRAGHMHAGLHGRDIFGETVAACRRRGLRVIGYYNIWNRWEFDRHPEWRMRDADGKAPRVDYGERFGLCCPNTGYRDFVERQIRDLCGHYELDGLWVDMIGWFGIVCFCDGCRRAWREATGLEMPERADFSDPLWVRFLRQRRRWQADFAEMIRTAALSCQPGLSVAFQNTSVLGGWRGGASMEFLDKCDYLAGDFYLGPAPEAFVCKFLRSASAGLPVEFMVSRCTDLAEHTTTKSSDLLLMQEMMAVSHMAAFVFIDAIDPVGTVDRAFYDRMRPILDRMDPYLPYMREKTRLLADAAIWFDPDNASGSGGGKTTFLGGDAYEQLRSAYTVTKTFISENIPFDVVTPKNLGRLSDYRLVVLPQSFLLSEEERAAFEEYVRNGGSLYVSGVSGLMDPDGEPREDLALADVLGVHFRGKTKEDLTYMAPTGGGLPFFGDYTARHPLCIRRAQAEVAAEPGVRVLATRTAAFSVPSEQNRFAAAISDPPGRDTGEPALTVRRYGRGLAMYSAGELEASEHDAQRGVFAALCRSLMPGKPVWESNAPKPVQINLYARENGGFLLCALNFQEELPAVPVHDLRVTLQTERPVASARYASDGAPCRLEAGEGVATLFLRRLDVFEMVVLDPA